MDIEKIFIEAQRQGVSDIFIVAGKEICFKKQGSMYSYSEEKLGAKETESISRYIYKVSVREMKYLLDRGDDDFSFSLEGVGRFRVNAYKQRGSYAMVVRVVNFDLPDAKALGIPEVVLGLSGQTKGLVLVTGPAGCGKSTTLACIMNEINTHRQSHIITLEDPIEFIHRHGQGIVSQREVGIDTKSYVQGLRAALREAPDVILLGEMRDLETISIAMTAAETGQLVFSTLHTLGAANTIDRIVDVFSPEQQQQVRMQLSMVLHSVISQQLIPTEQGVVPVFEIMFVNNAIRNMIREGKVYQIEAMIGNLAGEGMKTMDGSLLELYKQGKITAQQAKFYSLSPEILGRKLGM